MEPYIPLLIGVGLGLYENWLIGYPSACLCEVGKLICLNFENLVPVVVPTGTCTKFCDPALL